jgi:hypothetical protein
VDSLDAAEERKSRDDVRKQARGDANAALAAFHCTKRPLLQVYFFFGT